MTLIIGTKAGDTLSGYNDKGDEIYGLGDPDILFGHSGNDYLEGGAGADTLHGGADTDTAGYRDSAEGVFVSLISGRGYLGDAQGDRLWGIENLTGSRRDDTLIGDGGDNTLRGSEGDDTLKGGGGADTLDGGIGYDSVSYSDSDAGVVVLLALDHASGGHAHEDELDSIENLTGSDYDDHLWGNDDWNTLRGGRGNDTLKGFGAHDELHGGDGTDTLHGGTGLDVLYGEAGADIFVFSTPAEAGTSSNPDWLADFSETAGDRIDLSAIDANTAAPANQPFRWIGNDNAYVPEWGAGQLTYRGGYLQGDVNGDFVSDFFIELDAPPLHEYALIL